MKLWYNNEAKEWTAALPIGNGHMGAMCFGGETGHYELSENTCWSGKDEKYPLQPEAGEYMKQVRELLTAEKPWEAHKILDAHCLGQKKEYGTQLPLGNLTLGVEQAADSRYRELDLETGVALDRLTYEDCVITRTSFLSHPKKVMAVRLEASEGKLPRCCLWLEGAFQPCHTDCDKATGTMTVKGRALENIHSSGLTGVEYSMVLSFDTDGSFEWSRRGILIDGAAYVTLYLASGTTMFDENPEESCRSLIAAAQSLGFDALLQEHTEDHKSLMSRCSFTMAPEKTDVPTDARIQAFKEGQEDLDLVCLFFQYGRYLLMNSSRGDSLLPAALQGVWNDNRACRMEWTDDMHLDINTQMNYFPAEPTGLGECAMPLMRWIKNTLMPNGKLVAKNLFGTEGWLANTISNAYGWAAPGWDSNWGFAPTCGGWVALHIWDRYRYSGDLAFLGEYYEVLYEAAKGLAGLLTRDPETGELVTNPSYSPENMYRFQGGNYSITTGSSYDSSLTRYIFSIVQESAAVLHKEDAFTASLKELSAQLPPLKIGKHGQLMEWNQDFEETYPDHRHTCHLLALFPFGLIDPAKEPELKKAIEVTLTRRMGENAVDILNANWAGALIISYYARLEEGEKAGEFVNPMISYLSRENMLITHQGPTTSVTGGIYELDGNTGFTAAITEMLLQCFKEEVKLLPGIPKLWKQGAVTGLRIFGGHSVDICWEENSLKAAVHFASDATVNLSYKGNCTALTGAKGATASLTFGR